MTQIVKTLAIAVAITCLFAFASNQSNAQCIGGGGFGGGGFGNGFSSSFGSYGGRGSSYNVNRRSSYKPSSARYNVSSKRVAPYGNRYGSFSGRSVYSKGKWGY